MKKSLPLFAAIAGLFLAASCSDTCYDCTLKCGTCTLGPLEYAGCQGDSILQGQSIEAWKAYLEGQGFTCIYNNDVAEVCGDDNRDTMEDDFYTCLSK